MTHLEQHLRQCHRITFQQANVRAVQIVYLHGVNYVQDLWKVLSQDVKAGRPTRHRDWSLLKVVAL